MNKFTQINDKEEFRQMANSITVSLQRPQLKRFTKQELENRAKISNDNIEKGEVYTQEKVEKLSQNW